MTAAEYDLDKVTAGFGTDFDLRANTYKPYPCGIVVHPTIDGCIQLHRNTTRRRARSPPSACASRRSSSISATRRISTRALESKFSIYHAAAIGLIRGKGGLAGIHRRRGQRSGRCSGCATVTTAVGDPTITEDQAHIEVTLRDGRKLTRFVEQSLGNVHRPLSNAQLEEKFRDQGVLALPRRRVEDADRAVLAHRRARRRRRRRSRHGAVRRSSAVRSRRCSAMSRRCTAALARWLTARALRRDRGRRQRRLRRPAPSNEVRIPRGAGGVGFLPLLVMESTR